MGEKIVIAGYFGLVGLFAGFLLCAGRPFMRHLPNVIWPHDPNEQVKAAGMCLLNLMLLAIIGILVGGNSRGYFRSRGSHLMCLLVILGWYLGVVVVLRATGIRL